MRIITRYSLREVTSHALLGGVLFTFVLFMRDLGRILELRARELWGDGAEESTEMQLINRLTRRMGRTLRSAKEAP